MSSSAESGAGPVVLRAASGPEVGLGHAMRSYAVAAEVARLGADAHLVLDDAASAAALAARTDRPERLQVAAIGAAGGRPEAGSGPLWLDGFRRWEDELGHARAAGRRVLLVENRAADRDAATAVLYPALHHRDDAWDRAHPGKVLGGAGWIPLRAAVLGARPTIARDVDLLVTFGGSDPLDLTDRVLAALEGSAARIVVAVGALMDERRQRYAARLERLPGARLLPTGADLAPWLPRACAAVTALGTTLYELAYHRVPALVLANHAADAEALAWYAQHGPHRPLGVAAEVGEARLRAALRGWPAIAPVERPAGLGEGARRIARWLLARSE